MTKYDIVCDALNQYIHSLDDDTLQKLSAKELVIAVPYEMMRVLTDKFMSYFVPDSKQAQLILLGGPKYFFPAEYAGMIIKTTHLNTFQLEENKSNPFRSATFKEHRLMAELDITNKYFDWPKERFVIVKGINRMHTTTFVQAHAIYNSIKKQNE